MSTLHGRITYLERKRPGAAVRTRCTDAYHRPSAPAEARDYRMGLRPFLPPEMRHLVPPEPTCPTCGEPPSGIYVVARDWRTGVAWDDRSDDPGAA